MEVGSSIVVDDGILARPGVQRLLVRNRQDLRRMFTTLADFGVVQAWRITETRSAAA